MKLGKNGIGCHHRCTTTSACCGDCLFKRKCLFLPLDCFQVIVAIERLHSDKPVWSRWGWGWEDVWMVTESGLNLFLSWQFCSAFSVVTQNHSKLQPAGEGACVAEFL